MNTINLNKPPPNHQYKVSIEREEAQIEQRVRLFKDLTLFIVAIGFVLLIAALCLNTLQDKSASVEAQKWAMSILSAATGGLIGYLVRK